MKTFVCFFLAMLLARPVVLQANHTHEDQMLLARSVLKVVRSSISICRSRRTAESKSPWGEMPTVTDA